MRSRSALAQSNDALARHIQQHGPVTHAEVCLECEKEFQTADRFIRICPKCDRKERAQYVAGSVNAGFQQDKGLLRRAETTRRMGEIAGPELFGAHCYACNREVQLGERVHVDRDSGGGDDGSRERQRVIHVVCPPEEIA